MMTLPNIDDDRLRGVGKLEEYRLFAETADSGLFTRITRRRLVGELGLSGRGKTKADFWYDQRERLKTALKDLEIFVMVSGQNNFEMVFDSENMKSFIYALMVHTGFEYDESTAKIAQNFVEQGLNYLRRARPNLVTQAHEQLINHALDVSRLLANPEEYNKW